MKKNLKTKLKQQGFSLFEILVVMTLFVLIVAVSNQALFASFRGQNKSEATTTVKQNANFVVSYMQNALHTAQGVSTCTASAITYFDNNGGQKTFTCANGQINQSGAVISTQEVTVSNCNFSCVQEGGKKTINLNMTFDQAGTNLRAEEKSTYQVQTQVRLRN